MKNIDSRLRNIMKRIIQIVKQKDVGCFCIVVSPTHSEFRFHFPNWSVITVNEKGIRFKSKKENFDSSDLQHRRTEDSVHIICQIRDTVAITYGYMSEILEQLEKHMDIDHKPFQDFVPKDKDE